MLQTGIWKAPHKKESWADLINDCILDYVNFESQGWLKKE